MDEGMLLVALGCGRLPGILDTARKHPVVVFATMEDRALAALAACIEEGSASSTLSVYFYETG